MNNKKIIFLIPSMRGGGAEKVTLLLANELVKSNWDVAFAMSKLEGPYLDSLDSKIRIIKLPYKKTSRNILAIKSILKEEKPSIFYTSMNYVNIVGGIAHKISQSNSKLVFSEHSNVLEILNSSGKIYKLILRYGIKFTYPFSDHVICVSSGVEASLKAIIPNLKRISVIYNPIEQFEPKIFSKTNKSKYKILSIGRLKKVKNHLLLLKAFKYLLENYDILATLTIVGEGDEKHNLEQFINANNMHDFVSLPGFQDPNRYLKEADVFVMSSEWEGFGNVLVEALSTGIPVISTDCPSGPAEILGYGEFGQLVPIHDYQAMAKAIYDEYKTPPDIEKSKNRIERAQDFTPAKITEEYEDLFNSLLQTK